MTTVEFSGATLITGKSTDKITLYPIDLPTTFPEMNYDCCFTIEARQGYGETWLKENFPNLPYEVIIL